MYAFSGFCAELLSEHCMAGYDGIVSVADAVFDEPNDQKNSIAFCVVLFCHAGGKLLPQLHGRDLPNFRDGVFQFCCSSFRRAGENALLLGCGAILSVLLTAPVWLPSLLEVMTSAREQGLIQSCLQGRSQQISIPRFRCCSVRRCLLQACFLSGSGRSGPDFSLRCSL